MEINNLCAVTKELLYDTAHAYPEVLLGAQGEIKMHATLFALGFYINNDSYLKGVRKVEDVFVRHPEDMCYVYKTTLYMGNTRHLAIGVEEGEVIYDESRWHQLRDTYNKGCILQSVDLTSHISKEDLHYILDVGWDCPPAKREAVVKKEVVNNPKPKPVSEIPFWVDSGYTAMEWRQRKFFENHGTQAERDCMYVSEFEDLNVEVGV